MQLASHAVRRSLSIAGFLLVAICLVSICSSDTAAPDVAAGIGLHMDPAKVVGEAKCAECHNAENGAWHQTHHFLTFAALPKNPAPRRSPRQWACSGGIRRNKLCLNCHFTVAEQNDAPTPRLRRCLRIVSRPRQGLADPSQRLRPRAPPALPKPPTTRPSVTKPPMPPE